MSPEGGQVAAAGPAIDASRECVRDPRSRRGTRTGAPARVIAVRDQILPQAAQKLLIRIADYGRARVFLVKKPMRASVVLGVKDEIRGLVVRGHGSPGGLDSCHNMFCFRSERRTRSHDRSWSFGKELRGTVRMHATASILHADLDAFYASVEQMLDPSLRGKPIAVGGGVVLAASYEAKAFGVHGGMPGWQARELCPDLIFVGGHFDDYQRLGDAAIEVMGDFTPLVERISIDEAFADVAGCTHLFGPPTEIAKAIRRRVRAELRSEERRVGKEGRYRGPPA